MLLSLLPAYLQALEERLGCLVRGFKAQRGGKPFQGHSSQLSRLRGGRLPEDLQGGGASGRSGCTVRELLDLLLCFLYSQWPLVSWGWATGRCRPSGYHLPLICVPWLSICHMLYATGNDATSREGAVRCVLQGTTTRGSICTNLGRTQLWVF